MEEKTISILKVNLLGLLFFLVSAPLILYLYNLLHGVSVKTILDETYDIVYFFLLFVLSILLHELIHAAVFALFAKNKWSSIKIGVLWKYMTPYAHCSEPLRKKEYALALVSPGVILGVIPLCFAFLNGHTLTLLYGLIMLFAAIGDFIVLAMLSRVPKDKKILDHKSKVGFWVE